MDPDNKKTKKDILEDILLDAPDRMPGDKKTAMDAEDYAMSIANDKQKKELSDQDAQQLFNYLKEIEQLESCMSRDAVALGVEGLTLGLGSKLVTKGMTKQQIDDIIEDEAYSIIDRVGQKDFDKMFPKRDLTTEEMYEQFLKDGYVDSPEFSMANRRPDSQQRMDKAVDYYTKQLEPYEKSLVGQAAKDTAKGYAQLAGMGLPIVPTAKNIYDAYNKRTDLLNKADEIKATLSEDQLKQVEQMLKDSQPVYGKATPSLPAPSKKEQQERATHKSTKKSSASPTTFGKNLTEEERKEIEEFLLNQK